MKKQIRKGYIHAEPALGDYIHGDNKLGTVPLNPSGDWTAFLPPPHRQDENGFEVSDCVSEATINACEILEKKQYGTNSGWARRFLAKNSGTDERGGNDPNTVSEALRKGGATLEKEYPFQANSYAEFYKDLTSGLKSLAIGQFAKFSYGHSWVNGNPEAMKQALEYSPLSAAGYAWQKDPKTGYYITPKGAVPEHDFVIYGYEDGKYWKIWDSYPPYQKQLTWDFQFTGIKRHTLSRQIVQDSWFRAFINQLKALLGL